MATIEKRVIGGKTKYRVKVRLKGFPEETATFVFKSSKVAIALLKLNT